MKTFKKNSSLVINYLFLATRRAQQRHIFLDYGTMVGHLAHITVNVGHE